METTITSGQGATLASLRQCCQVYDPLAQSENRPQQKKKGLQFCEYPWSSFPHRVQSSMCVAAFVIVACFVVFGLSAIPIPRMIPRMIQCYHSCSGDLVA